MDWNTIKSEEEGVQIGDLSIVLSGDGVASESSYTKYRGRCKEYAEKACKEDSSLTLVRGYYHCWSWGKQEHWWCKRPDGSIYDPTVDQFPKPHAGRYEEFRGFFTCEECGREVAEDAAIPVGGYACCSERCALSLVGL